MSKIIALANQKGGVGKTTTSMNLAASLATLEKRVLLIDADSQANASSGLGVDLSQVEYSIYECVINGVDIHEAIYTTDIDRLDVVPSNINLVGAEVEMLNFEGRERIIRKMLAPLDNEYDYILIDCMPSLGMITINALVAADRVLIPVEAAYLPVKGLQQLIKTIGRVHRKLNPELSIMGILFTKVDRRTNFAKDIAAQIREVYGNKIHIFANCIPMSVRAAETTAEGKSIYLHDPKGIVAEGYHYLTGEVLDDEE